MDLHPVQRKIWPLPPFVLPHIQKFIDRRIVIDPKSIVSASEIWEALGRYERKKGLRLTSEIIAGKETWNLPTFEDVFRHICAVTHSYILEDELGRSYLMGVSL